jgi:ABC-type protease/lipase transport system fused ATPase/permease subunit
MLITHKTNILGIVDKIIVLAAGQVQSYGTRDEIMSKLLGGRRIASVPAAVAAR